MSCSAHCGCDMNVVYEPVCGDDGVSYMSPCQAACAHCSGDVSCCLYNVSLALSLIRYLNNVVKMSACCVCRCAQTVRVSKVKVRVEPLKECVVSGRVAWP
jgi:hypothetical protein